MVSAGCNPARGDWSYLGLSALAVVVSVLKAPPFPINDPALFEYFGREMLHGQRLYADLLDVKPPSIFIVNELWQRLFSDDYALQTYAEAAVNIAAIALFALLLRRWKIEAWAPGTFLFALSFSLPFPQFDYSQHYATFCIVLALSLSACGRTLWAGAALALATTFWIPAALTALPILLQPTARREHITLATGFAGTLALYLLWMLAAFGPSVFEYFVTIWRDYGSSGGGGLNFPQHGNPGIDLEQLRVTILYSALGPAVGVLVLLLVAVARAPVSAASRFALIWSACALLGTAIPPKFAEHYFLPAVPALSMAIASFGLPKPRLNWRLLAVAGALALMVVAVQQTLFFTRSFRARALSVVNLGEWIRSSTGAGAIVYPYEFVPEVDLAASAHLPSSDAGLHNILLRRFAWRTPPEVVVFGPFVIPPRVRQGLPVKIRSSPAAQPIAYVPVCFCLTGGFAVYVRPHDAADFHCTKVELIFWSPGAPGTA